MASFFVRLPEVLRTATFRNAATASAAFAVATLLLFVFIFWQATSYEDARTDAFLRYELSALRQESPESLKDDINTKLAGDLHRLTFAALFDAHGRPVAGDVRALPPRLDFSGRPFMSDVTRTVAGHGQAEMVRAVAARLPDGLVLMLGRSDTVIAELTRAVERALMLGLLPAIALALIAGTLASQRFLARIRVVSHTIERIMAGDLNGRLPAAEAGDAVDQLASRVNAMLDEIVRLLGEVKAVGDGIAHDLRTPLTRIRSRLEGALKRAGSQGELEDAVRQCIEDLDQTFAITTALLRIGEIENARRRAGFGDVSLEPIICEAAELYAPVAEARQISIACDVDHDLRVYGDRDLLFEAVANITDNAVKFTPRGGSVTLRLLSAGGAPIIRVQDTGPGIPPSEQAAVLQRFYRADRSRRIPGSGLGLSLVAAILRLHGFSLGMSKSDEGFAMDIVCATAGPAGRY